MIPLQATRLRFLELRIPPVVILGLCMLGMWAAAKRSPEPGADLPGTGYVAAAIFLAAIVIGMQGVLEFRRHGTTVNPHSPGKAASVVTTGIYAYTRNPMYLALAIVLVAWVAYLGKLVAIPGVPAFVLYMNRFQIVPEERVLAEKFGAAYDDYRRKVRRWI